MTDLVRNFGTIFKFPYKNTTNEVNLQVRKRIVTEILDTEKSYIKAIEHVVKNFLTPLLAAPKPIVPREEIQAIFGNIADLTGLHKIILGDLEEQLQNWSNEDSLLAPVFSKHVITRKEQKEKIVS